MDESGEREDILELFGGLLAAAEPEHLEGFHRDRLAARGVSLADAATARLLLLEIARMLEQGDPDSCERVALALDATLPRAGGQARSAPPPAATASAPTGRASGEPSSGTASTNLDTTMPAILTAIGSVDATMPALAPPAPPPRVEVSGSAREPDPLPPAAEAAIPAADVPRKPAPRPRTPAGDDDPLSVSVDDTVMFGHLEAIDLEAGDPGMGDLKVERWAEPHVPAAQPGSTRPSSGWRDPTGDVDATDDDDPLAPQLDLDRYAILCAWAELQPERRAQHNRQYGLASEEARRQLERSFEELFAAQPELRGELQRRMQMHLSWLKKS